MSEEVTPDALMAPFKGGGLKSIVIFTLVIHAVVILGSSVPFLTKKLAGLGEEERSEKERLASAVEEAIVVLTDIAEKYDLSLQDISDQFSRGGNRASRPPTPPESTAEAETDQGGTNGAANPLESGKSSYQTNLEAKAQGPTLPTFENEKDDIFD